MRATILVLLCSPGTLAGRGFAVIPSLLALYVQPYPFTLAGVLAVWVIALAVTLGVPRLRNHRNP